jgi:hypothetical protein
MGPGEHPMVDTAFGTMVPSGTSLAGEAALPAPAITPTPMSCPSGGCFLFGFGIGKMLLPLLSLPYALCAHDDRAMVNEPESLALFNELVLKQ